VSESRRVPSNPLNLPPSPFAIGWLHQIDCNVSNTVMESSSASLPDEDGKMEVENSENMTLIP